MRVRIRMDNKTSEDLAIDAGPKDEALRVRR